LKQHAFSNTDSSDLWEALEAQSGQPVRSVMQRWIRSPGYPLVEVTLEEDKRHLELTQRRFCYLGAPAQGQPWTVPVGVRFASSGQIGHRRLVLEGDSVRVDLGAEVDWVLVNEGCWGFYRVRYDHHSWRLLLEADPRSNLSASERLGLLSDAWASLSADMDPLQRWADLASRLAPDPDPDLWASLQSSLGSLDNLAHRDDQPALRSFVEALVAEAWESLGFDPKPNESARTANARARVLAAACIGAWDSPIKEQTRQRYASYLAGKGGLSPDLVAVAARLEVRLGGAAAYERAWQAYLEASLPQDKQRYLYALADTADPHLGTLTLERCLDAEVRSQDSPYLIAAILSNPALAGAAWEWLERNWPRLADRRPSSLHIRILEGVAGFVDASLAQRVKQACSSGLLGLEGPRVDQAIEKMDISVSLASRLGGRLAEELGPWAKGDLDG